MARASRIQTVLFMQTSLLLVPECRFYTKLCIIILSYATFFTIASCKYFTSKSKELISAVDLIGKLNKSESEKDELDRYINLCVKGGLDEEYVRKSLDYMISMDYVTTNSDRHWGNFGIIRNPDTLKLMSVAPIFDNGRSLLTANYSVREIYGLDRNVKCAIAKPFSGSYDKMYEILGKGFDLYYEDAIQWLKSQEDSFENKVLMYQLDRLKE